MTTATELFKNIHTIATTQLYSVAPTVGGVAGFIRREQLDKLVDLARLGIRFEPKALTPAQEHADELLEMVRYLTTNNVSPAYQRIMRELIEKIDPPKPVTLDEAINALHEMADYTQPLPGALNTARDILRRFNKDTECKVFATAKGEAIKLPLPESYSKGCIDLKSIKNYKDFLAAGWTEVQLIEHGYMK